MTFALLDNSGNWLIATDGSGLVDDQANNNIVLNVQTPASGAWSMSRSIVDGYEGAFYINTGTVVDSVIDQTTHINDFLKVNSPTLTNAGIYGRAAAQCLNPDPANFSEGQGFRTVAALENFMSASTGYFAVSCIVDSGLANYDWAPSGEGYFNSFVVGDDFIYMGLVVRNSQVIRSYLYDGAVESTGTTLPTGVPIVAEWKHQNGVLWNRINLGIWTSVTAGDIDYVLAQFMLFTRQGTNGKFFELAVWEHVPSSEDQDMLVANMMAWVGAGAAVGGGDGDYTTQDDIKRWRARLKKLEKELEGKKRLDREDADEIMALVNSAAYGVSPVPVQTIIAEVSQLLAEPPKVKQYDGQFGFGDVTIAKVMGQLREYEARMREEAMTREEVSLLDFLMMQ